MDELVDERRAAYAAIRDAGLTPTLYELEPISLAKATIDAIVDRADLFVGIYYRSFGTRQAALYGFTAIEYEFLRFLMRFQLLPNGKSPGGWSHEIAERVDRAFRDPEEVNRLLKAIDGTGETTAEYLRVRHALSHRMKFFVKTSDKGSLNEFQWPRFLRHLPEDSFSTFSSIIFDDGPHPHYRSAHVLLYQQMRESLHDCLADDRISRGESGLTDGQCLAFQVKVPNEPNVLARMLLVCFRHGHNLLDLAINRPNGPSIPWVVLRLWFEPFYSRMRASGEYFDLAKTSIEMDLVHELKQQGLVQEFATHVDVLVTARLQTGVRRAPARRPTEVDARITIDVDDSPGALYRIAAVTGKQGWNIQRILSGRSRQDVPPTQRSVAFVIELSAPKAGELAGSRTRTGLDVLAHHLRTLHGVRRVNSEWLAGEVLAATSEDVDKKSSRRREKRRSQQRRSVKNKRD